MGMSLMISNETTHDNTTNYINPKVGRRIHFEVCYQYIKL